MVNNNKTVNGQDAPTRCGLHKKKKKKKKEYGPPPKNVTIEDACAGTTSSSHVFPYYDSLF